MRVFVTGIAGFLGSHIARQFKDVSGIDNLLGGNNLHPNLVVGDILDDFEIDADIVFHTACYPHEGLSVFSPRTITESVYSGTVNVAKAALRGGVKKFVFCSSMSRYGRGNPPFTEEMRPAPVDPYGIAKVAAEDTLRVLCEAHGMELCIVVPHNIYGPGQRYFDPFRNVAAIMANRLLNGKPPIIYGDGEQRRCFSYIDDVTPWIIRLGLEETGIWNVGPDDEFVTINDLAHLLNDITDAGLQPIYVPDRPCEVKEAFCSSEKLRKLGFESKTRLREGLVKLVKWVKEQGPRPFDYHLPIEIQSEKTPQTWSHRLL